MPTLEFPEDPEPAAGSPRLLALSEQVRLARRDAAAARTVAAQCAQIVREQRDTIEILRTRVEAMFQRQERLDAASARVR